MSYPDPLPGQTILLDRILLALGIIAVFLLISGCTILVYVVMQYKPS